MADLPMANIPNFQLPGPQNIPQPGGPFGQLAQGFATGTTAGIQSQQNALKQQQLAQEKHKAEVDSALQFLATTGQQLQYLRPESQKLAISNSLNALAKVAPEFGIQPHTPEQIPDEAVDLTKQYSKLHEGYMKGDVSLPTFQAEGANILSDMSLYERNLMKENQGILGTPTLQTGQVNGQSATLNPESGQVANAQGQPMPGAQGGFVGSNQIQAQHQDAIRSLTSSFESQSQDAKNVFDNLNVFNSQMQLSRQFQGSKDTTGAVNAEKASLLAFAQMAYPGTGRPGNMEMLENMEKSGPYGTLIQQALNKVGKGEIMTDSQIKGLRQAAVAIAQSRESSQTDQENTTASAIKLHGGDPRAFLRNYRSSTIHSTSPLFPSQAGGHPLVGQTMKGYKFLGGDPADKENWAQAASNE